MIDFFRGQKLFFFPWEKDKKIAARKNGCFIELNDDNFYMIKIEKKKFEN